MRSRLLYIMILLLTLGGGVPVVQASTRAERRLVTKGNKLYTDRKYVEAASVYEEALKENPQSTSARYNLGLAQLRQVKNPKDTTPANVQMLDRVRKNFSEVAGRAKDRPGLAAKANYNLGNLEFNTEQYQKAIEYYKQALRIDADDEHARKNLRIAQKKLQQQNQNQNQNQQQQNQDQKQDQKQDQQKDQQQTQNQDKQQQQPQEQKINEQTAERILQAMDNKENQTRARVNRANKGEKAVGNGRANKRW